MVCNKLYAFPILCYDFHHIPCSSMTSAKGGKGGWIPGYAKVCHLWNYCNWGDSTVKGVWQGLQTWRLLFINEISDFLLLPQHPWVARVTLTQTPDVPLQACHSNSHRLERFIGKWEKTFNFVVWNGKKMCSIMLIAWFAQFCFLFSNTSCSWSI